MQKVPHLEGLSSNYSKLFRVVYKGSLADTKVLENITQYVVRGDFAGDVGEMEDALANVLGYKVAAELGL